MLDTLDDLLINALPFGTRDLRSQKTSIKAGERRVVSILFADLKGFTELSEQLDPEEVQGLVDRILKLFSASIIRHGGYVDKYQGDQVMALFGAKKASEFDTQKAILTGLEIVEILKTLNDALTNLKKLPNPKLEVRIGINTGLVTTGRIGVERETDFTAYGDAVNVASRLESHARPNRILVSDSTKEIVAEHFEFEPAGTIPLKGKTEPVTVYHVAGRRLEYDKVPLYRSVFVGRDREFREVKDRFNRAKANIGRSRSHLPVVVGIRSEPGLGKSRFVDEFIRRHPELFDGVSLLSGQTDPYVRNPFGLFTSLIKRRLGIFDDDRAAVKIEKLRSGLQDLAAALEDESDKQALLGSAPLFSRLFGIHSEDRRFRDLSSQALNAETQAAVRHFLEAAAGQANAAGNPCVVILEDLHWMDEGSASALEFLTVNLNLEEQRGHGPFKQVLLLATYRSEYRPGSSLTACDFTELVFQPLDPSHSQELLVALTDDSNVDEQTKRIVLEKSAGNPFFIEQWVNYMKTPGARKVGESIPDSLQTLVLSRLDQLEEPLKLLIQKAGVLGIGFTTERLARLELRLGNSGQIENELESLARAGWIQVTDHEDHSYTFKHVIAQQVAYDTLLIQNRKTLHELCAEIYIEEGERPEEYLTIYSHARKSSNEALEIEYGLKAADWLRGTYQNSEAIAIYNAVLEILERSGKEELVVETMLKKAKILVLTGAGESPETERILRTVVDRSRQQGMESWNAEALKDLGWIVHLRGENDEAMSLFTEACRVFELCDDKAGMSRCVGNIGVLHWRRNEYDAALDCNTRQLALSEELSDPVSISIALGNKGYTHRLKGEYDLAMDCFSKQLAISESLSDKEMICYAVGNMGQVLKHKGRVDAAIKCYDRAIDVAEEIGHKSGLARDLIRKAELLFDLGGLEPAEQFARKGLLLAEEIARADFIFKGRVLNARITAAKGDSEKADDDLKKMIGSSDSETQTATLHFERWRITGQEADRQKALELYEKLYPLTKKVEFANRITVLKEGPGHEATSQEDRIR